MKTLADAVGIEVRFARSARLDADLRGTPELVGYVLQASIEKALRAMAQSQISSGQGAFTWTGPYGGGKSSAALLVANLVGGSKAGKTMATRLVGPELSDVFGRAFPAGHDGWRVIPVTGSRTGLRSAITEAATTALQWDGETCARAAESDACLIKALIGSACGRCDGVLLILDELGKFLEHAVSTSADVHLLQELAEHSTRSSGRLVVIGILHQVFERYAERLPREGRDEWAKIQGRFQDFSILAGVDETIALLGRAIVPQHRPPAAAALAEIVARAMAARRPTDVAALTAALAATWPLNPVTALMLGPVSRQRFAQNERSVFGFLGSVEPKGFREFLENQSADTNRLYGPDSLWDYLSANFGMALASGANSARFGLTFEAIDRAGARGGPLHVALTKCAALIELFRDGSGPAVSDDILTASLPDQPSHAVAAAIEDLLEWAVLIRQPRLGGYAIFAGSDFDLEEAVANARSLPSPEEFLGLAPRIGLGFVAAKRHYFHTGTLRTFKVLVHLASAETPADKCAASLGGQGAQGDGVMVLVLADDTLSGDEAHTYARELAQSLHVRGIVAATAAAASHPRIQHDAGSLFAVEKVLKEHSQLQGDRIARREIAAYRSALVDSLQREVAAALNGARWWMGPDFEQAVEGGLPFVASTLADQTFRDSPILRSELIQRDRPSTNATAAVRELSQAMVSSGARENLGFTGFPAAVGLLRTALQPFGLHRDLGAGQFGFAPPDESEEGRSLRPVWRVLEEQTQSNLDAIYATWSAPPIGLRAGVKPLLALAYLLANRGRLAIYVDGTFQTEMNSFFVDRLLQDARSVSFRRVERTGLEAGFLNRLAVVLRVPVELTAFGVAKALFQRFEALTPYAKRCQTLSERSKEIRAVVLRATDPEALLFDDLPALNGVDDLAGAIAVSLDEVEGAYPALLGTLRETLGRVLGVNPMTFDGIAVRCRGVAGASGDLRFDSFVLRVAAFEGDGEIEGLASLLVHKGPQGWSDLEREQALLELARFGRQFREVEALVAVRERPATTEALALVVGIDPLVAPLLRRFELTAQERQQATELAGALLECVGQGTSPKVGLAALARAVTQLAAPEESL